MKFSSLRQHILTLAITGQLVEQRDSEPEVQQIGPAPDQEEIPFAIPETWKWVQLGQVFSMSSGKYIKAELIKPDGAYPCYGGNGIRGYTDTFNVSGTYNLIGRQGALCGNVHLVAGDFYATEHAVVARHKQNVIDPQCAFFFLTALNLNQYATATAQPGLAISKIAKTLYPVPPLEEQRRIVEVIDILMTHLDQVEQAYTELTGPMSDHFRNLLLQQAVSGQLVPQLDSEPEVAQIGPAPDQDELPFAIPAKWKWVQIGALLPFGKSQQVAPDKIPANSWVLGLEAIEKDGGLIYKHYDSASVKSSKNAFRAGNVLYGKMNPNLNKVVLTDSDGFCSTELIVLDVSQAQAPLLAKFLLYFLRSPYFVTFATKHSHGLKPRLDLKMGAKAWMPLPPLDEQRRIVDKLDKLFNEVKQLRSLNEFGLE